MKALKETKKHFWKVKQFKQLLLLTALTTLCFLQAEAGNKTWTNGGGTGNWSDASNWSGGLPGAGDVAIFGSSHTANCTVNMQVNVSAITIQTGYTGTITQASGDSIVTAGNFSQSAGTFTGGNSLIHVKGSLSVSAGTFTSTTNTLYVATNFTISSGATFNHNGGTVYFDLGSATTITFPSGTLQFNNLTFNSSVGKNITTGDTMVVNGVLSLLQNQVKGGVIRMVSGSSLSQNVAFSGGTTQLEIKAALTINPTTTNFLGLILNNAGAVVNAPASSISFNAPVTILSGTFNGGSNSITINDNFTQTGGTFTATSGTLSFDKNFTYTAGTFNTNSGTVAFTSANATNFSTGGKVTFNNATLNKTSASVVLTLGSTDTLKTSGVLTLTKGTSNGGVLQPLGNDGLSVASGYNGGTSVMIVTSANTYTVPAGVNVPALTLDNASAVVNLTDGTSPVFSGPVVIKNGTFNCNASQWHMTQQLTISGGTFNASSDQIDYDNALLIISSGATFNHNNGTVSFMRSAGSTTVTNSLKAQFYNLIINLSNGTPSNAVLTVSAGDTIIAENSLTLQAGSLDSGVVELWGDLTDLGGFAGGNGLLDFNNGSGARNLYLMSTDQPGMNIDDINASVYAPSTQNLRVRGTFTLNNGEFFPDIYPIVFDKIFTQNGGNFWNGIMKETMSADLIINNGAFYSTSDTLELDGSNLVMGASATYDHNNGIVVFNASNTGTTVTNVPNLVLYDVAVNLSNSNPLNSILTIGTGDTIIASNSLILQAGSLNSGILEVSGDLNDLGSFGGGTGTLYFANGPGIRNLFLMSAVQPNVAINDTNVSVNAPTDKSVNFSGTFKLINGDFFPFAYHAYPITFTGAFTQTGGTFWNGQAKETMNSNATISAGTFYCTTDTLQFAGTTFTIGSGVTFHHENGTLHFTGVSNKTLACTGPLNLNHLSIGLTGNAQLRPGGSLVLSGDLNIGSSAALNQSTSNIDLSVAGNFNDQNASGGLVYGTRSVTLNGSATQTLTAASGTESFYTLNIGNTSGGVHPASTDLYVYNQLALTPSTGGKVFLGSSNLTLNSAATISGGTSNEFIVTDGNGYLRQENIGSSGRTGSIVFPVGNTSGSYSPVVLQNSGTNDRFDVRVGSGVLTDGTSGYPVSRGAINRTYFVEEQTTGGSNVTLTLQWNAAEEMAGFDRTNCGIRHYTGGAWIHEGVDGLATGSGPYTSTASGITTFSPFDEGSDGGGGSLPIQLISFTGNLNQDGKVDLKWSSQIELNNDYYTIERSSDGVNYSEIGRAAGAGNSTIEHDYNMTDEHPMTGTSYYRLKQTDFNGESKDEGVVAITVADAANATVSLYPNPLEGTELKLVMSGQNQLLTNTTITISDMAGKNLYKGSFGANSIININLSSILAQGIYMVQINADGKNYQQKLLVR